MASVLWFQGGACSGNTMSFLNAEEPNVVDLIVDFGLDLLWHPSLGLELAGTPLVPVPAHALPVEYMEGPFHFVGTMHGQPVQGFGISERSLALYRDWELVDVLSTMLEDRGADHDGGGDDRADTGELEQVGSPRADDGQDGLLMGIGLGLHGLDPAGEVSQDLGIGALRG